MTSNGEAEPKRSRLGRQVAGDTRLCVVTGEESGDEVASLAAEESVCHGDVMSNVGGATDPLELLQAHDVSMATYVDGESILRDELRPRAGQLPRK